MKFILTLFGLALVLHVAGQENFASNVSTEVSENEKLLITYDIKTNENNKSFSVILLLTSNGNKINATSVYGDLGSNITPGVEKAIVWYFKNDFKGNIKDVNINVFAYKENEPQAIFKITNISNNGYAPCEITFINNSSYANEYQWDFGDQNSGTNNISFLKEPKHKYEKGGIYSISLTARNTQLGLENTYYQSIEIKEYDPTTADFEIQGDKQLPPAKVKFIDKSINADKYSWDFGDPASKKKNTSDKQNPDHKYTQAGTYTVTLEVKNNFSGIVDKKTHEVVVEQKLVPVAKFTNSKSSETAPSTVVFKNTSTAAVKFEWDFGDPSSGIKNKSTETDPVHLYANPGQYTVQLSAWALGSKKPVKVSEQITINALPNPPRASFTIKNNNVLGPATIIFENNSENATSYYWDFGDPESGENNTSNKQTPTHTYTQAGKYNVKLVVTHPDFKEKSEATDIVNITGSTNKNTTEQKTTQSKNDKKTEKEKKESSAQNTSKSAIAPIANFSITNEGATAPALVSFASTSLDADSFEWNFGDPESGKNTSKKQNVSHTYNKGGKYEVTLTVWNKKSGLKDSFTDYVSVAERAVKPVSRFEISENGLNAPAKINFINNSTNADEYNWDFGDVASSDNISTAENPSHIYEKEGKFKVVLEVKNSKSGLTQTSSQYVSVSAKPIQPVANFSVVNNNSYAPAEMVFTNQSVDADKYQWNFGDSGSNNNTSGEKNPKHTFKKEGNYTVVLTATNSSSGLSSEYKATVSVKKQQIQPTAKFEIENNGIEAPAEIVFLNQSVDADKYQWNFGDAGSNNNTSGEENANHTYKKEGNYTVVLTATNSSSGLSNEYKATVSVKKQQIQPTAKFEIENSGISAPGTITFKNTSVNADKYEWTFGDFNSENNTSTDQNPQHLYKSAGKYKVTLKVTNNSSGLSQVTSDLVTIKAPLIQPQAGFEIENNNIQVPAKISFRNTSVDADNYIWDFNDKSSGELNTSTETNPHHIFEKAGEYKVVLTAINKSSEKKDITEKVVIVSNPLVELTADFSIELSGNKAPANVMFKNLSKGADSYKWNFGDFDSKFNTSTATSPNHQFEKAGEYSILLEAKNEKTGEIKKITKSITLKSSAITFIKSSGFMEEYERVTTVIQSSENEYLAAISSEKKQNSSIISINGNGTILKKKKFSSKIYDLLHKENDKFELVGIDNAENLFIQELDGSINLGASEIIQESKKFKTDFALPELALSRTSEIGIIANILDSKYPVNILFLKASKSGKKIPLADRTFKYIGTKLATNIIPTDNGGFALTGYWQEKNNSPILMLFGQIDRKGRGEMDLIGSSSNILGYDIKQAYQGGFALLKAKENEMNNQRYELSFTLIDSEGNPTECANQLPCTIKKEDIFKYKPTMHLSSNGYVIATHTFNGTDYNIQLIWIDKTGDILLSYEEIQLPNDQFVTDFIETSDGGFLIAGTEKRKGQFKPFVIKTDKYGKINE